MSKRAIGSLTGVDLGHTIRIDSGPWRLLGSVRHFTTAGGGQPATPGDARTSLLHRDPTAKAKDAWRETVAASSTPCEVS